MVDAQNATGTQDEKGISSSRSLRVLRDNVWFGISRGLSIAAGFAILSTISGIGKKALGFANNPNPFASLHMTYVVGLACHFIAGVVAGAIGGVMRPLGRWLLGAIFIGCVAGAITVVVFSIGQYGRQFWNPETKGLTVAFACIGAVMAAAIRYTRRSGPRSGLESQK